MKRAVNAFLFRLLLCYSVCCVEVKLSIAKELVTEARSYQAEPYLQESHWATVGPSAPPMTRTRHRDHPPRSASAPPVLETECGGP
jgi:hypothetical protein